MRKLETTTDLLDALQERYGLPSDNQVAKRLGIPQATFSGWRRGRMYPTEVHAFTIAEALEIPPALVLIIAAADRTEDEKARAKWRALLVQVAQKGFGALAAIAVFTGTYTPPAKAEGARVYIPSNRRRRAVAAA